MKAILPTPSVTTFYPTTNLIINHLLPIYPTPIMYEPINVLILAWKSRDDQQEIVSDQ